MAMVLNNGICRCCSSEGTFKDVKTKYHWMGEEEVYAEMLKDCFDITLHMKEENKDSGICEVCITQLRNAANFKKQVLHTEQQFLKLIAHRKLEVTLVEEEIKNEIEETKQEEEMEEEVLSDHFADGDDDDPDFIAELKDEMPDEPMPKKQRVRAKPSTSKAAKIKAAPKHVEDGKNALTEISFVNVNEVESVDDDGNKTDNTGDAVENVEDSEQKIQPKGGIRGPLKKQLANIRHILTCSNATPIRSHGGVGYMCWWCTKQFPDAADLKKHSMNDHAAEEKYQFLINNMTSYIIKLDVTALQCLLCNEDMASPEQLIEHLKIIHRKEVYTDVEKRIFPFKFDKEKLQCFYCSQEFNKFKALQEHMNSHYRNFVCDVCGAGFVNRTYWTRHKRIHALGTFQCQQCPKIYSSKVKLRAHINYVHVYKKLTYRCRHCNELFKSYSHQQLHMAKSHGVELKSKCEVCQKVFPSQSELTKHERTSHLPKKETTRLQRTPRRIEDTPPSIVDERVVKLVRQITNKPEPKTLVRGPLVQHLANIRQIFLCSNATPIRCHGGIGYMCWWCSDQYPLPADLKSHTIANHTDEEKSKFALSDITTYVVKLDVTALQCLLCNEDMVTPEQLLEHLKVIHDKEVYPDVEKRILPFKFDNNNLRCFHCCQEFNKFKVLQEHMHNHYRNFVCEICNAGFINRRYWSRHKRIHSLGTFQCDQCPKVYTSLVNLRSHINYVHMYNKLKYRCRYCNALFGSYSQQQVHLAKAHGVELKTKCETCQKTFPSQSELTFHRRKYHMMENEFKCEICNKVFGKQASLLVHLNTHSRREDDAYTKRDPQADDMPTASFINKIKGGNEIVQCQYCMSMVKESYLRKHLKRKHEDVLIKEKQMDRNQF